MRRVVFLLLILPFFTSCKKEEVQVFEKKVRPVKYITVKKSELDKKRIFSGMAMPQEQAKISFKIPGTIKKIHVKVGDKVVKNQVLAELDSQIYQLQLQEAIAAQNNVEAQAKHAESAYKRVLALYENQHASKNDLESARTSFEMSRAGIKTVQTKIQQAQLQIEYAKIKAPDNGEVAYVIGKENENTGAGYPVVVINYGAKVEIEIGVPESLINLVEMNSDVDVLFDSFPEKIFKGKISKIGISPQQNAPTFPVTIELLEEKSTIKTGMIAKVTLDFTNKVKGESKIILPSTSVQQDISGKFIYIVKKTSDGKGVVEKRAVSIDKLTSQGVEIVSGVTEGEFVITAGVSKIHSGQEVLLIEQFHSKMGE
ncbi:efflux RND transporter periplasmic adaptor subunit [bacterium]|nr:efflux RND transporter periplasmic adaptor subunit [bacterium]